MSEQDTGSAGAGEPAGSATGLERLREALYHHVRSEEAAYGGAGRAPDTLAGHLGRVAALAARLAAQEGVDPLRAEIAGLFHDAGKFRCGRYHDGDEPEEERSVEVLGALAAEHGAAAGVVADVAHAIRQLYRDEPEHTPLSRVLFDADNLDKLGPLGVANHFVKSGLRGVGMSTGVVFRLTVELTYARYAPRALLTAAGRALAGRRSAQTAAFVRELVAALHEDGVLEARIEPFRVADLELDVVVPSLCGCGAGTATRGWTEKGVKCCEVHLEVACPACGVAHRLRFCRPRLAG